MDMRQVYIFFKISNAQWYVYYFQKLVGVVLNPLFCKICENAIVLQECKSKKKSQFHVPNSYKTRD